MKPQRTDEKIRVAITHGDINGIGYELIIKTLLDNRILDSCTPVVYGSSKVAAYHRKLLNIENFSLNVINHADEANPKRANIINCVDDNYTKVEIGRSTPVAGAASLQALEKAVTDLKDGKVDVLVTAPINKKNIQSGDFAFPGHTEYLASRTDTKDYLMLMTGKMMKIGVVTGHIPLSQVAQEVSTELILKKLRLLNRSLFLDFSIRRPVIAVLGLNPHAGDEGLIGKEDETVVLPAIQKAMEEGIIVSGPYAADGFFGSDSFTRFDAILAMYHDQGLIPFKALDFEHGVNYTCGLPFIRTSPAHGTAYDMAGKNEAQLTSFSEAIYLAIDAFGNRTMNEELLANHLQTKEVHRPENIHDDRQNQGEEKVFKLGKFCRDYNVSALQVVQFLKANGLDIDDNPANRIPPEYIDLLDSRFRQGR